MALLGQQYGRPQPRVSCAVRFPQDRHPRQLHLAQGSRRRVDLAAHLLPEFGHQFSRFLILHLPQSREYPGFTCSTPDGINERITSVSEPSVARYTKRIRDSGSDRRVARAEVHPRIGHIARGESASDTFQPLTPVDAAARCQLSEPTCRDGCLNTSRWCHPRNLSAGRSSCRRGFRIGRPWNCISHFSNPCPPCV